MSFKQANYLNSFLKQDITDLLQVAQASRFLEVVPNVCQKRVFFMTKSSTHYLLEKVYEKQPQVLVQYHTQSRTEHALVPISLKTNKGNMYKLKGDIKKLPLRSECMDVALFPVATLFEQDFSEIFPEMSRIITHGGRLVLSMIHPTLELLLYNQNPASTLRAQKNIEYYLSRLNENNLYVESFIETVVDKETKPFFVKGNQTKYYEEFKGIPLILSLRLVKYLKTSL